MATITQTIEAIIAGERYTVDNVFTGTHVSTIDGQYDVSNPADDVDIPIYAENNGAGDIKLIAFQSNHPLDKMQLLDDASPTPNVILDLLDIVVGAGNNVPGGKTFMIPGSGDFPASITANDIRTLRVSSPSGTLVSIPTIKLSILFSAIDGDEINSAP